MNEVGIRFLELSSSGIEAPSPPLPSETIIGQKILNEQRKIQILTLTGEAGDLTSRKTQHNHNIQLEIT